MGEVKKTMKAYVFPGQGSQNKGMGDKFFEHFNDLTAKANSILGYSIKELCINDPHNNLNKTEYTQPALYVVNALMYLKKLEDGQSIPDYVAGHSLGEYNALFAAGAFDFETGLKLVKKRGELIGKASGGAMAAVIGLSEEQVVEVLRSSGLNGIDIANFNTPYQIVISGLKEDIQKAATFFKSAKLYMPLKVSGAFHSRYMENARRDFELFVNDFNFSPLKIPVISNVEARPYKQDDIRRLLINQITNPVKWTESIRYLMGKGVTDFEEIGPGKVLAGIIQKIQEGIN
jgi:malonyl CoA-acyl carrier protein transacylase